jgi:hypothetical protein
VLGNAKELELFPKHHVPKGARIPFKVELRDFAVWLGGRDPFAADQEAQGKPEGWTKSLDAFLAAQIRHYSGGCPFDVSDLHALCRRTAILLVLDGLDEVASIQSRRDVIREVGAALTRLQALPASVHAIVTTRPAAFANSPGFPSEKFSCFNLGALTKEQIFEFAAKWIRVRKLQGREASDVNQVLKQKLELPHLRELARNPMQLTILLTLIHNRGASLPDKRTHLYDTYVDVFFARESEKSETVREHRELLIDMHRYGRVPQLVENGIGTLS